MTPYESATEKRGAGRRRAARYAVPVTVVGVAAATIGLVPALADSGDPDLPDITAQQLLEKVAASDAEQLSGTVKISTDLGLPDLGGLGGGLMDGATSSAGSADGGSSADPSAKLTELASGTHTLRVAVDGPDRQKVSLLQDAAEYSLIHDGEDVWGYDSASGEVYHSTVSDGTAGTGRRGEELPATPGDLAEQALKAVDDTTSVTVDGTAQVAGRDAYRLVVEPKQKGSTVGSISVAVDAETGVPLKFTLSPSGGGSAVVDAGFTRVSFAEPAASTFDFTPPEGAKVTEGDEIEAAASGTGKEWKEAEAEAAGGLDGGRVIGEGWNTIAAFDTGGEGGLPTGGADGDLGGFLDSLGDRVEGEFGSGTVFSTRLINALVTDDGTVYVGAVTKDALVEAADADQ